MAAPDVALYVGNSYPADMHAIYNNGGRETPANQTPPHNNNTQFRRHRSSSSSSSDAAPPVTSPASATDTAGADPNAWAYTCSGDAAALCGAETGAHANQTTCRASPLGTV